MQPASLVLRSYRNEDLPALVALFHDSVHRVTAVDYTPEQLSAWAPAEPDMESWQLKLAAEEVVVAEFAGELVGFCSWDATGYLDFLYVDPARQRQGIATALCARAEKALPAKNVSRIHTQSSLTAEPFFLRQGFRLVKHQTVHVRGVALTNAVMEKPLP
jgi:putative acetyltransferase